MSRYLLPLVMSALMVSLTAIAQSPTQNTQNENNENDATSEGVLRTVVLGEGPVLDLCISDFPEYRNPALNQHPNRQNVFARLLFDNLVEVDVDDGSIVPSLAKSWEISDNGRVYTFSLRKGVRFHEQVNGTDFAPSREFTADDVVFSFRRQLRADHPFHLVGRGEYPYFEGMQMAWNILAVDKIDNYTVQFSLRNPDAGFLYDLAMDFAAIHSAEYANHLLSEQSLDQIDHTIIGTGAYQLAKSATTTVTLYANPLYWKGELDFKRINIHGHPDKATLFGQFARGECDVLEPQKGAQLGDAFDALGSQHTFSAQMELLYLSFATNKSEFRASASRHAIAEAIDERSIGLASLGRSAISAQGMLPSNHWLYREIYTSARDQSRPSQSAINQALGALRTRFANQPLQVLVSAQERSYLLNPVSAGERVVQQLNEAGIFATLVEVSHPEFLNRTQTGQYDLALLGWKSENAEFRNYLYPILSCAHVGANNRTQWCDGDIERWFQEAMIVADLSARNQLYGQILQRVESELPLLPLAFTGQYLPKKSGLPQIKLDIRGGINWQWFEYPELDLEEFNEVKEIEVVIPEVSIEELRTLE